MKTHTNNRTQCLIFIILLMIGKKNILIKKLGNRIARIGNAYRLSCTHTSCERDLLAPGLLVTQRC